MFAYAAVPAVAIAGTLIGLTAKGAIASSISVSGQEYMVAAKQLQGQGFVQFGSQVTSDQGGKEVKEPVIDSGIANATLKGLCQSVSMGPLTMRLTAGNGSEPVRATNMVVAASGQTGSKAVFHNISVGQDASTLTKDGTETGAVGGFGQQADSVTIDNLRQDTWLTTAGTFTLPGLSLGFGGSC
ncbi:MAG: cholesterol esterase [Nocardiopsaceae bacterium]|nr:cholesterol esterase [Nocardiopsaceae bacterium]